MTMHKALHLIDDIDRPYVSRKEGRKGLESIEDLRWWINAKTMTSLKSEKRLITAANNSIGKINADRKTKQEKTQQKGEEK